MNHDVAVVGAGVSGCACATVLAEAGLSVLLLSSALDVVGLPGYGPDLAFGGAGSRDVESVFASLPSRFADAWLLDASVFRGDPSLVLIDRRAVSLRTKWLLESYPRLALRQALVTSLEVEGAQSTEGATPGDAEAGPAGSPITPPAGQDQGVKVRLLSSFGEDFTAGACVLAVGLALGGRIRVGQQVLPGGRYGEAASDALAEDLSRKALLLEDESRRVGGRFLEDGTVELWMAGFSGGSGPRALSGADAPSFAKGLSLVALEPWRSKEGPRLFPGMTEVPSPYDLPPHSPEVALIAYPLAAGEGRTEQNDASTLSPRTADDAAAGPDAATDPRASAGGGTTRDGGSAEAGGLSQQDMAGTSMGAAGRGGRSAPGEGAPRGVFPDGHAGRQWYATPGFAEELVRTGWTLVQAEHEVTGKVVRVPDGDLTPLGLPHVWMAGQAAGAIGYLGSLLSGAAAARRVLESLDKAGSPGPHA